MSPRKLLIEAWVVLMLAAPAALAEDVAPTATDEAAVAMDELEEAAAPAADETEAAAPPEAADVTETADEVTPPAAMGIEASDAMAEAAPTEAAESLSDVAVPESETSGDAAGVLDSHPPLGAIGYDSEGRRGRIHIVIGGDTLWDISDSYLGTPWVWPSIWKDNGEIENPHRIYPGDRIWITPSEMRRVTAEEAAQMLSNRPPEPEPAPAADLAMDTQEPAAAADLPPAIEEPVFRGSYTVSSRETAGVISAEQLEASGSIVERVPERVFMSQEDDVYVGLGEGEVDQGDQLTIFRTHEKVFDPDTGQMLGYHVEFLGWVEVKQTFPETSLAEIRMSTSEIEVGDRLLPREPLPAEIPIQASPADIEGKITFFPQERVLMGYNDFVYLNRGSLDGLEVGSPLEVYEPGRSAAESARGVSVHVPDHVVAQMLVVRSDDQSAVALITHTARELKLGDRFRGSGR